MHSECERGLTLAELLLGIGVLALGLAVSLPALAQARARGSVSAGARVLVAAFHAQRWRSVALGAAHGLLFERGRDGWHWYEVQDGNGNGLRTQEVAAGTDRTLGGPHRLDAAAPGVHPGLPPTGPFPDIPPSSGSIDLSTDPVRFGQTDLVAFGPLGTSSTGRIYLTDGAHELQAVVLYGPTGRARVWRYDIKRRRWRN